MGFPLLCLVFDLQQWDFSSEDCLFSCARGVFIIQLLLCRIPKHTRCLERHTLAVHQLSPPANLSLGTASHFTPAHKSRKPWHETLAIGSNKLQSAMEACLQYFPSNGDGINCQWSRQSGCMCHSDLLMLCFSSPGFSYCVKLLQDPWEIYWAHCQIMWISTCRFLPHFRCVWLLLFTTSFWRGTEMFENPSEDIRANIRNCNSFIYRRSYSLFLSPLQQSDLYRSDVSPGCIGVACLDRKDQKWFLKDW